MAVARNITERDRLREKRRNPSYLAGERVKQAARMRDRRAHEKAQRSAAGCAATRRASKVSFTFRVDETLYRVLHDEAQRRGRSVGALVREALAAVA
jgi:predicted HicB family RNase H-like nuclease